MTDEEFGRAWAKQEGKKPWRNAVYKVALWQWDMAIGSESKAELCDEIVEAMGYKRHYETLPESYAALGKAIRQLHRQAPPLRKDET
jgi:phosphoenolpyruvate carboxylase